ncbi:MAG: hypothetical protein KAT32_02475 [Candidatus Moranbacteria bacterium]|nr:hypothetical protein [Candidatus Moranbacteria bacterium]
MKNKFIKIIFVFALILSFNNQCLAAEKECDKEKESCYKLLESVPPVLTAGKVVKFPEYISKLYIVALSAIGIASLLMLTIGGFFYLSSAGNQSTANTAKKIITDALLGLAVAFISYVILYTINPDILSGKLDTSAVRVDNDSWTEKDQKKFDEGLEASERLDNTDWDKIHDDIDEAKRLDEERKNQPDIFTKPEVDPDREQGGMTKEEIEAEIEKWEKENL